MKKIVLIVGSLLIMAASRAMAVEQVHYFVPVQADLGVKVGVNASSANPVDGSVIWKCKDTDELVTIRSSNTTSSYALTLPQTLGNAGEALATDANGNLYWVVVSTLTTQEVKDQIGNMIANSTHNHITANYDGTNLNLSVSSSVILDGKDATLAVVNVDSMTSAGSITATQFNGGNANLNVVNVSSLSSAGSILATSVQGGAITGTSVGVSGAVSAGTFVSTGTAVIGTNAIVEGDVLLKRDQSIIFNKDTTSDSKISQESADDALKFYRNNILYMQFE